MFSICCFPFHDRSLDDSRRRSVPASSSFSIRPVSGSTVGVGLLPTPSHAAGLLDHRFPSNSPPQPHQPLNTIRHISTVTQTTSPNINSAGAADKRLGKDESYHEYSRSNVTRTARPQADIPAATNIAPTQQIKVMQRPKPIIDSSPSLTSSSTSLLPSPHALDIKTQKHIALSLKLPNQPAPTSTAAVTTPTAAQSQVKDAPLTIKHIEPTTTVAPISVSSQPRKTWKEIPVAPAPSVAVVQQQEAEQLQAAGPSVRTVASIVSDSHHYSPSLRPSVSPSSSPTVASHSRLRARAETSGSSTTPTTAVPHRELWKSKDEIKAEQQREQRRQEQQQERERQRQERQQQQQEQRKPARSGRIWSEDVQPAAPPVAVSSTSAPAAPVVVAAAAKPFPKQTISIIEPMKPLNPTLNTTAPVTQQQQTQQQGKGEEKNKDRKSKADNKKDNKDKPAEKEKVEKQSAVKQGKNTRSAAGEWRATTAAGNH